MNRTFFADGEALLVVYKTERQVKTKQNVFVFRHIIDPHGKYSPIPLLPDCDSSHRLTVESRETKHLAGVV